MQGRAGCRYVVDQQEMLTLSCGCSLEAVSRQVEALSPGAAGLPPQSPPSEQTRRRTMKPPADFVREPFRGNPRTPESPDWVRGYKTDGINR